MRLPFAPLRGVTIVLDNDFPAGGGPDAAGCTVTEPFTVLLIGEQALSSRVGGWRGIWIVVESWGLERVLIVFERGRLGEI